jgi:pyruvate dehydrogenase E2 component (dihydrolipoamide acetyltransferase)
MPYEAEAAGTIRLRAAEGDTVAVGAVIAVIGDGEEPATGPTTPSAPPAREEDGDSEAPTSTGRAAAAAAEDVPARNSTPMAGSGKPARANVSPVARRIAIDLGVDLADLEGSGPGGRIVKADLSGAGAKAAESPRRPPDARPVAIPAAASAPAPGADTASPSRLAESAKGELTTHQLTRLQQVIARRMAQSKATAPEFVLKTDVDMEAAVALRAQLREIVGAEATLPSYNDFVVKACALALRETPLANGSYVDGSFELHGRVNVGIAVAATGALVVPTIFDADQKSLGEIARRSRELAAKVREGEITPPELSGGTFSVSNLGMFGVDEFTAVINPPQAAILAVGTLKQRAVVRDDQLVARQTMTISLTCDHRILYGAEAADFLAHIRRLLEAPGGLVL